MLTAHFLDKFINTEASTAGFSSHFESWPGQFKLPPAISSCTDKWFLLPVAACFLLHELPFVGMCLHICFHQIRNLTYINMCLGIKEHFGKIPKGQFPTHIISQNKWWKHLKYRKDRLIHQTPIKAFYWRQHYQAVFLRDDREGE